MARRGSCRPLLVSGLLALAAAGCGTNVVIPGVAGAIPHCDDVPRIEAAPELYRDAPIYVANEMPVDDVRAWAEVQRGYEGIWIDREHLGWITLAFSRDAEARNADLAREFPGAGVVAVGVSWTAAEMEALQERVMREGRPHVMGSGFRENYGVVTIALGVLEPEVVAEIEAKFGGLRVCIEGMDPADAPVEGPQQQAGEGWRLLADQDETGQPYRTGIAADGDSLAALWAEVGLAGAPPAVDFESEVAIWFGAVHGSSCPRLRLDDIVVDIERSLVYPVMTRFEMGACTADAIGHAYVVALERARLPHGPFTIQLSNQEPSPGTVEEKTIVDADLSVPGSTVTPDDLHSAPPVDSEPRTESGGFVEQGYPWRYRLPIACGIEWLGQVNSVWWRTEVPAGEPDWVPPEWRGEIEADGTIDLTITLEVDPEPHIVAVAGSHTVTYRPSPDAAQVCS